MKDLLVVNFWLGGTATGLCMHGMLTSGDWVAVTLAYIGSQALVDLATQWKHGKNDG